MTVVGDFDWAHGGVRLEVLRMGRADLHKIRPGISMDDSHDPDGLGDSGELDDGGRRDLPDALSGQRRSRWLASQRR
jgi:hypothetical protein